MRKELTLKNETIQAKNKKYTQHFACRIFFAKPNAASKHTAKKHRQAWSLYSIKEKRLFCAVEILPAKFIACKVNL